MKNAKQSSRNLLVQLGLIATVVTPWTPAHAFTLPQCFLQRSSLQSTTTAKRLSLNDDWTEVASQIGKNMNIPSTANNVQNTEDAFQQLFSTLESSLAFVTAQFLALPTVAQVAVELLPFLTIFSLSLLSVTSPDKANPVDFRTGMEPYARGNYDPIQAKAFYSRHPGLVFQRGSQVFRLSNGFLRNLLWDKYVLKDEEKNRAKRALELLDLVTQLGPTAIKIGQALSVRPDLIPEEYARALSTLQDQVPPFEGSAAKEILRRELGAEKFSHLKEFPFMKAKGSPVASASIGQVYRGFIDTQEVAIKVQRPNVLAEIALDLHLVREFAPYYKKLTGAASDLQGLADEWGRGFIQELDYRKEAEATTRFTKEMKKRKLNSVCAPAVIEDYSTEQVLTTEWIDGVRIDQSTAGDVPRLCAVALNAYLVMLLELQSLHCDPHPGNLLRRKDGTLIILDFGMTLDIDPSLQYSLLEYVAHLTANDYDKLPEDLTALGFLKADKLEFAKRSGVLEPLKYFLKQASEGGGAKAVRDRIFDEYRAKYPGLSDDELRVEMRSEMKARVEDIAVKEGAVTGITLEVEELQRRNRDSFRIPEWFLYTSRAFLTLEGVSLEADENFSIIKSCFPYVAKRLLGDDSPRAQKALRELLYGAENQIDSDRVMDLVDGFSTYTTTSKTMNCGGDGTLLLASDADVLDGPQYLTPEQRKKKLDETEATLTLAKDSADILLSSKGSLVQTLLLEESVRATSAQVKDNLRSLFVDGPKQFRNSLPFGAGSFLPPLPFENQLRPFVAKSAEEEKAQQLAGKLLSLVSQQQVDRLQRGDGPVNGDTGTTTTPPPAVTELLEDLEPEQLAILSRELRQSAPQYVPLVGLLGAKFTSGLLETAANNIDRALVELESNREGVTDGLTKATARGLSSVAKRSASRISDQVGNAGSRRDST